MRYRIASVITTALVAVLLPSSAPVAALILNPDLCQGNNTSCSPQSNWPFVIADITGSGTLTMNLTTSLENNVNQYVQLWGFNLNPAIVPSGAVLTFNLTSGEAASIDNISSGS